MRVEAELVHQVADLLVGARNADGAAAFDLGNLPDQRADGAGGSRYHHGLARLRTADFQQAEVCRQARHPEDVQGRRNRSIAGVDFAQRLGGRDGILLPPEHAFDDVAGP